MKIVLFTDHGVSMGEAALQRLGLRITVDFGLVGDVSRVEWGQLETTPAGGPCPGA